MKRTAALIILTVLSACSAYPQNFSGYPIVVRPLDSEINSAADEYAPFLTSDRSALFFTSYRKDGSRGEADIFHASRSGERWLKATGAGSGFNTPENDGALIILADGKSVLFAADKRGDGYGDTDLWFARLEGDMPSGLRNLGARINTQHWESQPAVSGDGKTIVFVSNRPGGYGGTDLWIATGDGWGNFVGAIPLPAGINTAGNECSPYLTADGGTLYFSSNGLSGYGGYDIWMTNMEHGSWSQPANLGPVINSDEDDMFFHAPEKDEEFYLASSRKGGYGGLDLYAGTPNVFGAGMFRLTVSVLDSVNRKPLPSIVTVFDMESGDALTAFATNSKVAEYSQLLPAARRYRVEARIRDYAPRVVETLQAATNTEGKLLLLFGPITIAEFDLGRYNVPFFVTGYYRPNTRENLRGLFMLLEGPLYGATYIERFRPQSKRHLQYQAYAETVEGIFQTVFTAGVEEIFPRFALQALPSEILEIRVTGYADPQPLIGKYLESEDATFVDLGGVSHTVSRGDVLDNLKLSGLRAWHAGNHLDRLFTAAAEDGKKDYLELKKAGRIRYVFVGGDVSDDQTDYAAQRRIRITMSRTGEVQAREHDTDFDLNKNFK